VHNLTHLQLWQFFLLADRLQPLIERPQNSKEKVEPNAKHDYHHRLFFCQQKEKRMKIKKGQLQQDKLDKCHLVHWCSLNF
jgi:hypothetical protein